MEAAAVDPNRTAAGPPSTLFEAVAQRNHGALASMFAINARDSVVSHLSMRHAWATRCKARPSEEKLDEFLHSLSYESPQPDSRSYQWLLRELADLAGKSDEVVPSSPSALPTIREADCLLWDSASTLSNLRPPQHFVIKAKEGPPIFDGSVANSTPPPLGGGGASGGAGTILHLACALDSPLSLALFLAMGADARATHTAFRRLMTHEAACNGSSQCLRLLLELGAQLAKRMEHTEKDVRTTSSFLELLTHYRRCVCSLQKGLQTELDAARSVLSMAHLTEAQKSALVRSCSFLPARSFIRQFGSSDGHGNTPLHWAAFKNETECVSLLLQYKANPNARAHPSGWTPLHDAAYSNSSESIQLLIEAGATVDVRANSGATPLCFAAQEDAEGATQLLLDRGADICTRCAGGPNATDTHHHHSRFSGYTPLHYCAHYNASRAAKVLLKHAAAPQAMEITDLSDRLPIHVAVARGSSDVLRELLRAGARVETPRQVGLVAPPTPVARSTRPSPERPSTPHGAANSTPVSSPVLRSMIPSHPITSSKPWNCLTQRSIDECRELILQAEQNWDPTRHSVFTPADRRAVLELLRVGKHLELRGSGIFVDLWPLVLSFCGRGWFEQEDEDEELEESDELTDSQREDLALPTFR